MIDPKLHDNVSNATATQLADKAPRQFNTVPLKRRKHICLILAKTQDWLTVIPVEEVQSSQPRSQLHRSRWLIRNNRGSGTITVVQPRVNSRELIDTSLRSFSVDTITLSELSIYSHASTPILRRSKLELFFIDDYGSQIDNCRGHRSRR